MTLSITHATIAQTCRISNVRLDTVLDLGPLHLSGFLHPLESALPQYPLELCVAGHDSQLVQLRHSVPPNKMFRRYFYRSGTNEAMKAHLQGAAREIARRENLQRGSVVVDIGANDGTLLQGYADDVTKVAFEPSNIRPQATNAHIVDNFFGANAYPLGVKANAVTSFAMFYDLDDPIAFAQQIYDILQNDGVWVTEQHWLMDMLKMHDYSVICHEHLSYYSTISLEYIANQAGFVVTDIEFNSVNGGSFRAYLRKYGERSPKLDKIQRYERKNIKLNAFAKRVRENKVRTKQLLWDLKRRGKVVAGLGASTKFNTVLQYCDIGPDLLSFISDRNPVKNGLVTSGSNIPIVSEAEGRSRNPDYYLIGPYHFFKVLQQRESAFLKQGGKFIVLFPEPEIVE